MEHFCCSICRGYDCNNKLNKFIISGKGTQYIALSQVCVLLPVFESICFFQEFMLSGFIPKNFTSFDSNKIVFSYAIFNLLVKFCLAKICIQHISSKYKESMFKLIHSFINLTTILSFLSRYIKFIHSLFHSYPRHRAQQKFSMSQNRI